MPPGTGTTGTLGAPAWSTGGKFGNALVFDGVNDSVVVNDAVSLDLTNALTVERWANPRLLKGGWRALAVKEGSGAIVYGVYANASANRALARIVVNGVTYDARSGGSLPLNTWSHLGATYNGTTLRLYVNGTDAASRSVSGSVAASTGPLPVGGNGLAAEWFDGTIDEIRVYNRALTQAEIQADMTAVRRSAVPARRCTARIRGHDRSVLGPVADDGRDQRNASAHSGCTRRRRAPDDLRLRRRHRRQCARSAAVGLVAAYSFNSVSGATVADVSGNNNSGTLSGAVATVAGKYGGAVTFDGVNDWVTVADSNSLDLTTGMTLMGWVSPTSVSGSWRTVIFKEGGAGSMDYSLYAGEDAAKPIGQVYIGGEQNAIGPATLPLAAWTHLAVTYDGAVLRLFVNGTQVATRSISGQITPTTGALRIGGNSIWSEWFQGAVDEVRIYNRALSQGEIQTDMTTALTP
jgi:Concanavalin A-like lectin/glucanases superfamily